ncbi:MAG: hypothetical protein KFF46_10800, partial [Desulfobacterales bacterium]|nr:hypothetical protein [Desulfobacterales bacterium]
MAFMLLSEYIRPPDQLVSGGVAGRSAFIEATVISEKWLDKMGQWGIITSENHSEKPLYRKMVKEQYRR